MLATTPPAPYFAVIFAAVQTGDDASGDAQTAAEPALLLRFAEFAPWIPLRPSR